MYKLQISSTTFDKEWMKTRVLFFPALLKWSLENGHVSGTSDVPLAGFHLYSSVFLVMKLPVNGGYNSASEYLKG